MTEMHACMVEPAPIVDKMKMREVMGTVVDRTFGFEDFFEDFFDLRCFRPAGGGEGLQQVRHG